MSHADPMMLFGTPSPLLPTYLDPQETSVDFKIPAPRSKLFDGSETPAQRELIRDAVFKCEPIHAAEVVFRHSGWEVRRGQVMVAMERQQVPAARLDRFINCGSGCQVMVEVESGKVWLSANYCHDRCCIPCGQARAVRLVAQVVVLMMMAKCRFVTLTMPHVDSPLSEQIDTLLRSFRLLRQSKRWKEHVTGGGAFLEVKRSKDGTRWHPHLHVIVQGSFFPQKLLQESWSTAVGVASIVHVRQVDDARGAAGYCAKYCTKPLDATVFGNDDWLDEAMIALKGRRLFMSFGSWYGVKDDDDDDVKPVSVRRCSLVTLLRQSADGDLGAQALLERVRSGYAPIVLASLGQGGSG